MFQSTTNRIGMTLVDYNVLKKYSSGVSMIKYLYEKHQKGITLLDTLYNDKDLNKTIYTQGGILTKKLPRENNIEDIKAMTKHKKKWENVVNNIQNIKGKGIILNCYSNIGEQSLMATSYLTKCLKETSKINHISGVEFNEMLRDLSDSDNRVSNIIGRNEVLIIFSQNSIGNSDWLKQNWNDLLELAFEKNVPIILSSKKELKITGKDVVNIGFTDEVKNESQLIEEIFS